MRSWLVMMLLHILDVYMWWMLLLCGRGWSTEYLTPVREGTRFTMNCSGSTLSAQRKIVWLETWDLHKPVIIAICYASSCVNTQYQTYKGAYSANGPEYSSQLAIMNVSAEHRRSSFECSVLDYVDQNTTSVKAWTLAGVYSPPELVDCHTAILTDPGDILVWCQIDNFYPDIVCQITISFNNESELGPIRMKRHDVVNSRTHYYNSNCSHVLYANESGLYKFSISVFPNVGNISVTADVINTSCQSNVTLKPSININQLSGDSHTCQCALYRNIECRGAWFDAGVPRFLWYLESLKVTEGISETNIERRGKYYTYVSILTITPETANATRTVTCALNFTSANFKETVYSDSKTVQICSPSQTAHFKLSDGSGTVLGKHETFRDNIASFVCEVKDSRLEPMPMTVVCELSSGASVTVSNNTSVALSFAINHTTHGAHCTCFTRSSDQCYVPTSTLKFNFGQTHPLPRHLSLDQAYTHAIITVSVLAAIAFLLACGSCIFIARLRSSRNACPCFDKICKTVSRNPRSRRTRLDNSENMSAFPEYDLPKFPGNRSEHSYLGSPVLSSRVSEASKRDVQSTRHLLPHGHRCSQQTQGHHCRQQPHGHRCSQQPHGHHCRQHLHTQEHVQVARNRPSSARDTHGFCDDVKVDRYLPPMDSSSRDNPAKPMDVETLKCSSRCPYYLLYCRTQATVDEDNYIAPLSDMIPQTQCRRCRQECGRMTQAPDIADSNSYAEVDGNSVAYISPWSSPCSSNQDLHALDDDCFTRRTLSDDTLCPTGCEDILGSARTTHT